ncbi:MAG TPA: fumarylacetoacetate hydrolase family protein [Pseudolabrys sp.]|nr:fumarylacetoacetate hydrolase family protein [Pseudolabrys sp.]
MKLASYWFRGRDSYGAVEGDGIVDLKSRLPQYPTLLDLIRGDALSRARESAGGTRVDVLLADVELLPPLHAPEKILCVGINYANRNTDYDFAEPPQYPSLFYKAPNALVGSGQRILIPTESIQLDYEGEIAIVIGKEGRRITREAALDHIAGVTLCNEGTIRDWTRHGKFNVTQGKNWDATGSIGPWIVTADAIDLREPLHLITRLNGEVTQDDTTAHMIFPFAELIRYVSTFMTLKPGDVIATGTPVKLRKSDPPVWLKAGDVLEISVPEIGALRNTIAAET